MHSKSNSGGTHATKCVQCVLIGDGDVGKTNICLTLAANLGNRTINRRSFIHFANSIEIKGERVYLKFLDVPDQEEFDTRAVFYRRVDVFIICFSLVNPASFESVRSKWYPEVRYFCPDTPILLVGTKLDLRINNGKTAGVDQTEERLTAITYKEGLSMAKEIGAVNYVECSAITKTGLNVVPQKAIRAKLKNSKTSANPLSHFCKIL